MQDLIRRMVDERTWAVVGVSDDPGKFGYRIYKDLKAAGYEVYGVNPRLPQLDGDPIYADLASVPKAPAVVNVVVPPAAAQGVVEQCVAAGIRDVWFQPGAENLTAIAWAEEHGLNVVWGGPCSMVQKKHW